jgi:hypothetical protein
MHARLQARHRRWLVAATLAAIIGVGGVSTASAVGRVYADGSSNSCWETDRGQASTVDGKFDTNWQCAVTTSTNVTPLPTNSSAGGALVQASYSGLATCGTTSTSTDSFTFSYEDAFGGFSFSGDIRYWSSDLTLCRSNYAGQAAIHLTSQFGLYASIDELCSFSIIGQYNTGATTIGSGPDTGMTFLKFDVDNTPTGTACTTTN